MATKCVQMKTGIPEGWKFVRIGQCLPGEAKLSKAGEVLRLSCGSDDLNCVIVEKDDSLPVDDGIPFWDYAVDPGVDLADTIKRIAGVWKGLQLSCKCPDNAGCDICEIQYLLDEAIIKPGEE